jgi:hypothetical protein
LNVTFFLVAGSRWGQDMVILDDGADGILVLFLTTGPLKGEAYFRK